MERTFSCPGCRSTLPTVGGWLARRLPTRCPGCGAGLLYDTAGGVYLDAARPADGAPPDDDDDDATSGS